MKSQEKLASKWLWRQHNLDKLSSCPGKRRSTEGCEGRLAGRGAHRQASEQRAVGPPATPTGHWGNRPATDGCRGREAGDNPLQAAQLDGGGMQAGDHLQTVITEKNARAFHPKQ